jgi:dCTP diphosphatase
MDANKPITLNDLKKQLRLFATERDWDQFHSVKNLCSALSVESAELLEITQWLTEDQSNTPSAADKCSMKHELADIFLYLIQISAKLDINLIEAAEEKIQINAEKYPISKSYGVSTKYTDFNK